MSGRVGERRTHAEMRTEQQIKGGSRKKKKAMLKYHDSIQGAVADLGQVFGEIGLVFAGFQQYLYQRPS